MANVDVLGALPEDGEDTPLPARRKQFNMFDTHTDVMFKDPDFHKKFYPFWRIDIGNRVAGLIDRGFAFVEKHEIENGDVEITPANNDAGSRVRRYAGTGENGNPTYFYLMKQPMQYHLEDEAAREVYHSRIDGAIQSGQANRHPNDGRYTAADGVPNSKIPGINFATKLYR